MQFDTFPPVLLLPPLGKSRQAKNPPAVVQEKKFCVSSATKALVCESRRRFQSHVLVQGRTLPTYIYLESNFQREKETSIQHSFTGRRAWGTNEKLPPVFAPFPKQKRTFPLLSCSLAMLEGRGGKSCAARPPPPILWFIGGGKV